MDVLEKREHKSMPYKSGVFHLNSREQKGDNKQVNFKAKQLNGKRVILIESPLLESDNFRVIHAGARISLIISKKKKVARPLYIHNMAMNDYDFSYYEKLKSFDFHLPDDYYVHTDTIWNESKKRVEVYFR